MKMFLGYCGWVEGAYTFNEEQVADNYDSTYVSGDGMGGAGGGSDVDEILNLKIGESMTGRMVHKPVNGHYSVIRIADDEDLKVVEK